MKFLIKNGLRVLFAILSLSSCFAAEAPSPHPVPSTNLPTMSLSEVLRRAEQFSPNLKASYEGERVGEQSVRVEQSLYYPTLDLTAVDSTGFPASANVPVGFNGVMSSPYRVGLSGGAFTTFTFFDLTREYGVKAAHYDLQSAKEETKVRRLEVDLKLMDFYMDAVLDFSQREAWKGIQAEVDRLYGVVKKFVRNGQYSQVTTYLLQNQIEQAIQKQEDYDLAYKAAVRRIEINIGANRDSIAVQGLDALQPAVDELNQHHLPESPLISYPQAQTKASEALTLRESAQNYPRLFGIASAGAMEDTRLVPEQNFSAWIGLTFPLFEGFKISAEEARARAQAERSSDLSRQAQIEIQDADTKFEQQVLTHQSDIKHFQNEKEDALQALKLAEHRYITFVGDLADVRDSLYSYESAESGLNAAQVELFRSKLSAVIIDGGYLEQTSSSKMK